MLFFKVEPIFQDRQKRIRKIEALLQILDFRYEEFKVFGTLLSQDLGFNLLHRIERVYLILSYLIRLQQLLFHLSSLFQVSLILIEHSLFNCLDFGLVLPESLCVINHRRFAVGLSFDLRGVLLKLPQVILQV